MTTANVLSIFRKDAIAGPRGMFLFWLVAFPVIITFVLRLVFGDLLDPEPRLGIADLGDSAIPAAVEGLDGIRMTPVETPDELRSMVESHDLDAGIVLQPGFDQAVKSGEAPELQFFLSGKSLASNRIILAVTAVDLVRDVAGQPAPVNVVTRIVGDGPSVPIQDRLVPLLVLLAVAVAGVLLPAAAIIQEKERLTIAAVITTPATMGDFMAAKALEAFILACFTGVLTLLLNLGFGAQLAANIVIIVVAALMCVPIGLMIGAAVNDMGTMFTVWKSGGIVLFAPAILFLFPSVPRWIAMLFPTYYFLGPLYDVNIAAVPLRETLVELSVAVLIGAVFAVLSGLISRKMEYKLAMA